MDVPALLLEIYGRIPPLAEGAVDGLTAEQLATAPAPGANTIGWLIWHLTRVQDHHVAELMETGQIWTTADWAARCGLDADPNNTGYGHDSEQVLAVRPETPDVLLAYLDPGTGSMVFQMLIAGLLSSMFVIRSWTSSLKRVLARASRNG